MAAQPKYMRGKKVLFITLRCTLKMAFSWCDATCCVACAPSLPMSDSEAFNTPVLETKASHLTPFTVYPECFCRTHVYLELYCILLCTSALILGVLSPVL